MALHIPVFSDLFARIAFKLETKITFNRIECNA